ncbi:hypothetical protein MMC07_000796 [Pseudocyphellaria aurata]|nr:hypothetical protein [Pseudocyphellaria aurata]
MESLRKDPRPRGILRYSTRPPKDTEFEMFKMPKTSSKSRGVVVAIEETGPADFVRSSPSKPFVPKVQTSESTPRPISSMSSNVAHEENHHKPSTPALRCLSVSPAGKKVTPRAPASSPTPVRSNSIGSASAPSPVMRSIFPRYDPNLSLAKQHYYPTRDIHRGPTGTTLQKPRPFSSAGFPSRVETPSSNPTQIDTRSPGMKPDGQKGVPVPVSEISELAPATSTPEELLDLWSVANGQGSQEAADKYTLKLSCPELELNQEIISFTSSSSQTLYKLEADENSLAISRSHPINPTTRICISAPKISKITPNNPLIATVFPKLAELMAIDQSSSIAVDHRLDRQASDGLQAEALERAHQREASTLFWDTDSEKYYLIHPTLSSERKSATFTIQSTLEEIKIFAPIEPPIPVLALSFSSLTITIHTQLLAQLPSLYILDTLLSALLILLLHVHRTSASPSPLAAAAPTISPHYPPPPPFISHHSQANQSEPIKKRPWSVLSLLRISRKRPKSRSKAKTNLDDEESAPAGSCNVSASASPTAATANKPNTVRRESGKLNDPDLPTPAVEFETLDPTDEKLPRSTRAILKLLSWAFGLMVWALGVGFKVLAAIVVGMGKCVARL